MEQRTPLNISNLSSSDSLSNNRLLRVPVDIDKYEFPGSRDQYAASQAGVLAIGDLHANALKLFYMLTYHGVLNVSQSDYETVRDIYKKSADELTPKDIKAFDDIINNATLNDVQALLLFIGDELADRGSNDYFVLKIFEKLHKANINFDILFSNHGAVFMRSFQEAGLSSQRLGKGQEASKENLRKLIQRELVSEDQVRKLVKDHYLSHVQPAAFYLNDNEVMFAAHAPVGREVIDAMVKRLEIQINFPDEWTEGEQLAAKIEVARVVFRKYVEEGLLFEALVNQEYEDILGGSNPEEIKNCTKELSEYVFEYLAWNRNIEFMENQRPVTLEDKRKYTTVHGHDPKKSRHGNVYNLDNILGKWTHYHKTDEKSDTLGDSHYTVLYSPQKPLSCVLSEEKKHFFDQTIKNNLDELDKKLPTMHEKKAANDHLRKMLKEAEAAKSDLYEKQNKIRKLMRELNSPSTKNFDRNTVLKNFKQAFASLKNTMEKANQVLKELTQPEKPQITDVKLNKKVSDYLRVLQPKNELKINNHILKFEEIEKFIEDQNKLLQNLDKETADFTEVKRENLADSVDTLHLQQPGNVATKLVGNALYTAVEYATPVVQKVVENTSYYTERYFSPEPVQKNREEKTTDEVEKLLKANQSKISLQKTELEKLNREKIQWKKAMEEKEKENSVLKMELIQKSNEIIEKFGEIEKREKDIEKREKDIEKKIDESNLKMKECEKNIQAKLEEHKKNMGKNTNEINAKLEEQNKRIFKLQSLNEKLEQENTDLKQALNELKKKNSDELDTLESLVPIEKAELTGDEILTVLQEISRNSGSLADKKQKAVQLIESGAAELKMAEILKLHTLVQLKHTENDTNPYKFIRREQDFFRCDYGNTRSWQKIMEAIKSRLTTLAIAGEFEKLNTEDKQKFRDVLNTHTVHDGGFGNFFFRKPVIAESVKVLMDAPEDKKFSV